MPSRIHGKDTDVFVDEFDFSGVTNDVSIDISNNLGEVTAFADTDATFVEGKAVFSLVLNGLYSAASPDYDGEMFTDLTATNRNVGIYPSGYGVGNRGYEGYTEPGPQERVSVFGDPVLLNVTWRGDRPIVRAQVLQQATAIGTTTTGTAYQTGQVSATQKVWGILRLLAVPGGAGNNDCVVTVQSDDNEAFTSATTRLTFSTLNQASVATHETQEANGAITDDWWRAVVTISGAGSRTFNLLIAIGITAQ